ELSASAQDRRTAIAPGGFSQQRLSCTVTPVGRGRPPVDRGRDARCQAPPAQTRTRGITASGSYHRYERRSACRDRDEGSPAWVSTSYTAVRVAFRSGVSVGFGGGAPFATATRSLYGTHGVPA